MTPIIEWLLLILLIISISLNIVLLKRVRDLNQELRDVGARVSVTKEELFQIRKRLEKMKSEI
jgi:predicted amino acid-binding ACT domain protein